MNIGQKSRLERYFKNSSQFLWGLSPHRNQQETYVWLQEKGFKFDKGSYKHVTGQLLLSPGLENIITNLIIPRVQERFTNDALGFLRACWNTGMLPDMSFLASYSIRDPSPLLEINWQFKYIEKWGEFAGIWFEEIERLKY